MMANWERRKQFAESLLLERERRQGAVEKSATNSLVSALFPKGVSEQVIEALASRAEASESASVSTTCSKSNNKQNTSIRTESFAKRAPLLANSYATCAIVTATVGNVDRAGPPAAQLEALSRFFIASDAVAASVGAEKIKTVGTSVMFAVGVPTASDEVARKACELAVGLKGMLRELQGQSEGMRGLWVKTGIAMGPVVAGVIGVSTPRYDIWGYTVVVARKLMEACAPGQILATKDVAKNLRTAFKFRLMKELTFVNGVGHIMLIELSENAEPSPPVLPANWSCTANPFSIVSHTVTIEDVAKGAIPQSLEKLNPVFLWFGSMKAEMQFLAEYTEKFYQHTRWLTFSATTLYVLYSAISVASLAQSGLHKALRFAQAASFSTIFLWTLMRCHKRPVLFHAVLFALSAIVSAFVCILFDTDIWHDTVLAGLICWLTVLNTFRMPFCLASPLGFVTVCGCLPIVTVQGYPPESAVIMFLWYLWWSYLNRVSETSMRQLHATSRLLRRSKEEIGRERQVARSLLASVIPEPVLERLVEPGAGKELYLATCLVSGTVLVSKVVGFEGLYRTLDPSSVVELLNALFTRFDQMAAFHGLSPLRTDADEYIVVANMAGDTEDHASRAVRLAVDMTHS
eukprot:m51a1_g13303 putative adenylate guanylate cyclase (632) ;mRNA; r:40-2291